MRYLLFILFSLAAVNAKAQCTITGYAELEDPTDCYACNGRIEAVPTSGVYPFTYSWNNGETTSIISDLCAGKYVVTITDASGCIYTDSFDLHAQLQSEAMMLQQVNCNGGSNGLALARGLCGQKFTPGAPYHYAWYQVGGSGNILLAGQTDSVATGLAAGTYFAIVSDADADTARTPDVIISEPPPINAYAELEDPTDCYACNGRIEAVPTSGVYPFTYSWNNGETTSIISDLCTGKYVVTITDASGCIYADSFHLHAQLQAEAMTLQQVNCNGGNNGSAMARGLCGRQFISGAPYHYAWYQVNGSGNTLLAGQTDSVATGLSAGTYFAIVSDADADTARTPDVIISEPTAITTSALVANPACFNGTDGGITIAATGGTPTYTYAIGSGAYNTANTFSDLAAGSYIIHIQDANNCIEDTVINISEPTAMVLSALVINAACFGASNGEINITATGGTAGYTYAIGSSSAYTTTNSFSGLTAGSYTIHIQDANNCTEDTVIAITQPTAITSSTSVTNAACFGGSDGVITTTATGGTPGYTYAIGSGDYTTANTFSGLTAGEYTLHVKDANGCVKDASETVEQPTAIATTSSVTDANCFNGTDGTAIITATGGILGYTYAIHTGPYSAVNTFSGLTAGSYTLHAKDANGCIKDEVISVGEPTAITALPTVTDVKCFNGTTGSVIIAAVGGTPGYTYAIDAGTYSMVNTFSSLTAGSYTLHVKDINSCIKDTVVNVAQPVLLSAVLNAMDVTCYGGGNGSVAAVVAGGVSPYTYEWSNAATTATISNVGAGIYSLYVKDANDCEILLQDTVIAPDSIHISATVTQPACNGICNGSVVLQLSGGTGQYTYSWSNSTTGNSVTGLCGGGYSVSVTDAAGCSASSAYTLASPSAILVDAGPDKFICRTGTVTIDATIADAAAVYSWSSSKGFSANTALIQADEQATYYVAVTSNGCTGRDTVNIQFTPDDINAEFLVATQCFKDSVLRLINISSPMPDSTRWVFPSVPGYVVLEQSAVAATAIFTDTGSFTMTMVARNGQCEKTYIKKIVVIEGQPYNFTNTGVPGAYILNYSCAPNPSSGKFKVHVELAEDGPIRLRLISLQTSGVMDNRQEGGQKVYDLDYSLNQAPGIYMLVLESAKASQTIKINIQ